MVIIGNGMAGAWSLAAIRFPGLRTRALWWFTVAVEASVFVQVILGVCLVFFTQVMDETGFDPSFPIFAFIFLVALGVDYNIFLMDRVREEAHKIGTVRGGLRALVSTGR